MDGRVLAAGLAGAASLAVLGLVAVVMTGEAERPAARPDAPVLIARAAPPVVVPPPVVEAAPVASVAAPPAAKPAVVAALPPTAVPAPKPPAPKPPPPPKPVVDHRYDGVLTVAEIGRMRTALRLSPDQEPYWPAIASVLREIGRRQMDEVDAGQKPSFDLPGDLSSRLYTAVGPLLGTLRDDQKDEVRRRAKMMGLDSVASFI